MEDALKVTVSMQIQLSNKDNGKEFTDFRGTGKLTTIMEEGAGETELDQMTIKDGKWFSDGRIVFVAQGMYRTANGAALLV